LPAVVADVYRETDNVVLIEKYLGGREFCVAVAGSVTARGRRLRRDRDPFTFATLERLLSADERIFTSMDVRPITRDRCAALDHARDAREIGELRGLACEVFREFNLGALIRLDVRSDEDGRLYILEANPKPDLKQPADGVTSLISVGLPEAGMDYDDLILSLLADRLDFLFTHRVASVQHILDLLGRRSIPVAGTIGAAYREVAAEAAMVEHQATAVQLAARYASGDAHMPGALAQATGEAGKQALDVALAAMRSAERPATAECGSASASAALRRHG
jgi:hypothetical protein